MKRAPVRDENALDINDLPHVAENYSRRRDHAKWAQAWEQYFNAALQQRRQNQERFSENERDRFENIAKQMKQRGYAHSARNIYWNLLHDIRRSGREGHPISYEDLHHQREPERHQALLEVHGTEPNSRHYDSAIRYAQGADLDYDAKLLRTEYRQRQKTFRNNERKSRSRVEKIVKAALGLSTLGVASILGAQMTGFNIVDSQALIHSASLVTSVAVIAGVAVLWLSVRKVRSTF